MTRRLLALLVPLVLVAPAHAADDLAAYVRSHYTKFEYRIPMRDGVELFTAVYVPNDRSRKWPILLTRTPYGVDPYGADRYPGVLGPSQAYAKEGFIFAEQDVRGRFMSGGEFVNMRPEDAEGRRGKVDESTDTWDTIDWLVKHVPDNDGKVGMYGTSYPGFYAAAGAIDSHPALKAVSPQAPIANWFWDDFHRHGAFVLPMAFDFFSVFGKKRAGPTTQWPKPLDFGTPDGYQFFLDLGPLANVNARWFHGEVPFWNDLAAHPNYDAFWKARDLVPHLKHVKAAVLTVGGWFDTEDLYGPLHVHEAIEKQNPGTYNVLVMGPWRHGGWAWGDGKTLGDESFGFATAEYFRQNVELPFFRHFLKGEKDPGLPEALAFETGADRWRRFDAWPPKEVRTRSVYLREGGALAFEAPTASASGADEPHDSYVSDPAKPVPYTMEITAGWAWKYMAEDQRFAAWRPDVLVYRSRPMERDLTIAGPIMADLWVSTTGRDADFVVKIIDEYPGRRPDETDSPWHPECKAPGTDPGGTQRLVRVEVFRGRFRDSYERPEPFTPGKVTRVRFRLNDVLHTFLPGHRMMVQIQSTFFPFVDRNPQSWVDNIFEADEKDFVKATESVYRSKAHPSRIDVGVLPQPGG